MITKGKQAKEKLLEGINGIADVVKMTLGAKGKTVLISEPYKMGFHVTKDGYEITKSITFEDNVKNCGADFIKNAANIVSGNLYNDSDEKADYEIATTSTWNNFNISNPSVIKTNNEVLLFEVK